LVVLQKVDLLEDEAQLEELRSFVAKGMSQLLGIQPKYPTPSPHRGPRLSRSLAVCYHFAGFSQCRLAWR
jgi:hypothetical protein